MNKKISLSVFAAAMAMAVGNSAFAEAPTAELKVTGMIAVPGCDVVAENNGVYDFGTITPEQIKAGTATTTLSEKPQNWTITCDGTTYLTFNIIDERADSASASDVSYFGLGNINGTGKIGYYTAKMTKPMVDGVAASAFASNGGSIGSQSLISLWKGYTMGWSSGSAMKAGKSFSTDIVVTPTLAGTATMNGPLTDRTELDGLLTMNFAFGL